MARDLSSGNAIANWHLFSVSFDPRHDSTAVLKAYADRQKVDSDRWSFVSGEPGEIDLFCQAFGLYFSEESGTLVHNLVTVAIDAEGRIRKLFSGNRWKPEELIDELVAASVPQHHEKIP